MDKLYTSVVYENIATVMNYNYSEKIGPVEKIFVFVSILQIFPNLNFVLKWKRHSHICLLYTLHIKIM
jgi:hypothetical protein